MNISGQFIEEWVERFENWVNLQSPVLAETDAAKKDKLICQYLLSSLGEDGYCMVKASLAPDKLSDKEYKDLKECILSFVPKHSAVSESYKLSKLRQEANESLTMFMSRVKQVASKCDFDGAGFDRNVRDRFICGLRSEKLRSNVISDENVKTSAQALAKAIQKENSLTDAHDMSVNHSRMQFHRNKPFQKNNRNLSSSNNTTQKNNNSSRSDTVKCSKCTLFGHFATNCRTRCRYCKKCEGHIAKNCPKKKRKVCKNMNLEPDGDEQNEEEEFTGGNTNEYEYHINHIQLQPTTPRINAIESDTCDVMKCELPAVTEQSCDNVIDHRSRASCFNSHEINCVDDNSMLHDSSMLHDKVIACNAVSAEIDTIYSINDFGISKVTNKPFLKLLINGKYLNMELDTGSSVTVISRSAFMRLNLTGSVLHKCKDRHLVMADGRAVRCGMSKVKVEVKYRDILKELWLYVVEGEFQTLFGSDWISAFFGPEWIQRLIEVPRVNSVLTDVQRRQMFIASLKDHEIFSPGMGQVVNFEAKLDLKPDYKPKFCSARKVAYSIKDRLGATLDEMEKDGRLIKVDHSEFASPVVPVLKKDDTIRICGDYKGTLNPQLDTKIHPLPVLEDCFVEMKGGKLFTKLDIKQAYNHIKLREGDQILTTINTHQGLYKWTCLSYGLSPAGGIFQSVMDWVLKGISGVTCRVDDILIKGVDFEDHFKRVWEVVRRLQDHGFRCKWEKSEFCVPQIIYLGYEISAEGVRACRSKVETLLKAPYPDSLSTLISFLGAVQYYGRFIPQLSTMVEPLNRLRTSKEWKFEAEEKKAFDELKKHLASNRVLTFYDPDKPVRVDCDASAYGIGAVLSHVDSEGRDRPVDFISRTLTKAERNYSQIEKEGLAIVWAVKRFHKYLFARPFELLTDHKPLEILLDSRKQIPEMGTSRIIRWALILSHYNYKIRFRPTGKHSNADFCSRYPLPETEDGVLLEDEEPETTTVFSTYMDKDKPLLDSNLISRRSAKDPVISQVIYCVKEGWPERADVKTGEPGKEATAAFYVRKDELSVEQGCLLWGHRVVIPSSLRDNVLQLLHSTHMGMTAMKSLARNYVWWPKLDKDVEDLVRHCETCQMNQRRPKKAVPHPWRPAQNPWERVHVDFAGPFMGRMWMLLVDAYSKWIEVLDMRSNTKSDNVIKKLRVVFSRLGLPKCLVSDNGPQLISDEFEEFCSRNGINHIPVPRYHPSSNGQIESIVGKFKAAMTKLQASNSDIGLNLANWLLNYHNTPHSTTGVEPSVRMLGRRVRSALSLIHPLSCSRQITAEVKQEQKVIEGEKQLRRFDVGDQVLYRDVRHQRWKKGTITKVSDVQYGVKDEDGYVATRHVDHLVAFHEGKRLAEPESSEQLKVAAQAADSHSSEENVQIPRPTDLSTMPITGRSQSPQCTKSPPKDSSMISGKTVDESPAQPSSDLSTRPVRSRRAPDRLIYSKPGGE